jgi:TetR/AcrR family transcriptional regulator, regulator of cefoperazone and chloramphenicol sensitivity
MQIPMTDPTAKSRVREAALVLFAEDGFAATSLRAIAASAGVSPGLIVHHFGSKAGLRRAVDVEVARQFDAALPETVDDSTEGWQATPLGRMLRTQPTLVRYLGRSLAEDAPVGRELFHRMFPNARSAIDGYTDPTHADEFWSSIHELVLIIGPLFLLRFLDRELGRSLLDHENLRRWMEANTRLLGS